ncbi:hypothetical protein BCIN_16g03030 [Botrytis cinerea B05.10]|uniref:Uncharacterized protein n=1 Tax=Botryotinia fuckeliana (strain B05.10) TaxID=332648 RepID=A0A384K6U1_BOTFB|nr:hypothetical protein BCIN_16g03030 [Botrytis cinerea B05.10]XP_024553858.1 hypothetical protein BCIN_16g03030 [Botrytis cinerea B05.10]ATZ58548.1 hypothetical protein BCIN_16g03030 [Botrytis cinerea B05.10]ATZ58550.1 hypothetical protein BCIN_16g03030 [Botrytis cinerea B05.10]
MLAIDDIIAICFGLTSVLLAIISLYVMCKPKSGPDIPEPDLESGPRTASLPSNRAYPISVSSNLPNRAPSFSAYYSLPSRAQASLHDRTHNHLRSIGSTPQCATNQFQDFAMFVPALTYAAVEPSPEPTIELYQVTHSANFISYNRSWG